MSNRLLPLLIAALSLVGCETLPPPRDGRVVVGDAEVRIVFSDRDRRLIADWYDARRKPLPPGLAKKDKPPPGHAKQMERGHVPPGLEHRYLPHELERQLVRLPEGYVRVIVGADVTIMNVRTQVILDVIRDVADD